MQNKKLIALILLGVGAIVSLAYGIITPSKVRRELSSKPALKVEEVKKLTLRERVIPKKRLAQRTDFVAWGKSPFLPKEVIVRVIPKLILNGIVWDKKNPKAIINGEIVNVGDKVDESTVVDIRLNRVILNDGTENFELKLEE